MEVKYALIASSVIISSAIISMANIEHFITDRENILILENGKVRLGKVYEENVTTNFHVINKSDNTDLINITAQTKDIYDKSESYIKDQIDAINKNGGVPDKDGKKTKLDYQSVNWTTDAIVKKTTTVTYRSEYSNNFTLTIDASEETIPAGTTPISTVVQSLQDYSKKMLDEYQLHNSLIK